MGRRKKLHPDPTYIEWGPPDAEEVIIVDMDGTVALLGGRDPFKPHTCDQDPPHEPILSLIRLLQKQYHIVIVTGRHETVRQQTLNWLAQHGIFATAVFMRPNDNSDKDSTVKAEIFRDYIAPKWRVKWVFEDRKRVVEMWRWLGLPVLQVQDGDY